MAAGAPSRFGVTPPSGGLLLGVREPWGGADAAAEAVAASLAASSAPFLSSRSLLSLKSLLSEAVSHSSLAWSEEFWLDKSGDLVPTAAMVGLLVSGNGASIGEGRSGAGKVAATSVGTVTGVPGALDRVGEREIGADLGAAAGTGGRGTGGLGAVSPLANTAASRSFKRLKRGGLSCLGGRAGRDLRGLSLLL